MKYKINLLVQENGRGNFLKKLNFFFFNYFRYILVITQLVVISVLFFRFNIDQNIIDLKESIKQQEEVLKAVKPILDESIKVDAKLNKSKNVIVEQNIFKDQLTYLLPTFPSTIFLSKLSFTKDSALMRGNILNPSQLQAFFKKIKTDNKYKNISLSDITRGDTGYEFSMTLNGFKN